MWRAPGVLVSVVVVLLALGIVMLASTSSVRGGDAYRDPSHFLKKQLVWLAVALAAGISAATWIDYHWWRKLALPLAVLALIGLALVFVPSIGCSVGGARRWVKFGSFRVGQPSELAKFAAVAMLAAWMARIGPRVRNWRDGLAIPLAALAAFLGLILLEPDYGTTFLLGLTGLGMLFAAGTPFLRVAGTGLAGAAAFAVAIAHNEERMRRFLAFLDPARYPDESYQLRQSLEAFILGGAWGVGLGESVQKYNYLPEAHTDFILAIIGEELGLVATVTVLSLFVAFFLAGMLISVRAADPFGRLLAFGLTMLVSLQAAINVGVVTGCLPTKGLPLPFISAGGSNLVMSLLAVGVLVSIARHAEEEAARRPAKVVKDSLHWV